MTILWAHVFFFFFHRDPSDPEWTEQKKVFYVLCHIIILILPVKLVDASKNEGIWQNNSRVVDSIKWEFWNI